jgi:hypothetical protein
VAFALLVLYWVTLAPTITEVDSGELCAAVHIMGVPHPTGYPLYLILGKLFDLLPLGEPARRVAFFSAVSAAAGGGVVCWFLIALTGSIPAGVLGGLTTGLNPWVWTQANQAEVYALNVLLICLVLAAFIHWAGKPNARRLNVLAFFCGLSLTHHSTAIFLAPPMLVWAAAATARKMPRRRLGWTALCAAAPLLLYLWLPYRSAHHPLVNWGNTSGSVREFWNHITARGCYGYAFAETPARALMYTKFLFVGLWKQFNPGGLALAAIGLAGMLAARERRFLGVTLMLSFVLILVWVGFYKTGEDRDSFYVPAIMAVSIWAGAGLGDVLRRATGLRLSPAALRAVGMAGVAVAVILPARMIARNFGPANRSEQYRMLETAAVSMAGIPRNALVLLWGDEPNGSTMYWFYVLHPDRAPLLVDVSLLWLPPSVPLQPEIPEWLTQGYLKWGYSAEGLACAIRERLDSRRPLYTNFEMEKAPPGYVVVKDYPMTRLVPPPGMPESADAPGLRPALEFPGGAGALLGLKTPRQVSRGEPFRLTAAVRWTRRSRPEAYWRFAFVHSSAAARAAGQTDPDVPQDKMEMRETPFLFGTAVEPNAPGCHYEQALYAIISRSRRPGTYQVFAQLANNERRTPLALVGAVQVR